VNATSKESGALLLRAAAAAAAAAAATLVAGRWSLVAGCPQTIPASNTQPITSCLIQTFTRFTSKASGATALKQTFSIKIQISCSFPKRYEIRFNKRSAVMRTKRRRRSSSRSSRSRSRSRSSSSRSSSSSSRSSGMRRAADAFEAQMNSARFKSRRRAFSSHGQKAAREGQALYPAHRVEVRPPPPHLRHPLRLAAGHALRRYEHGGFKGDVAGGRLRLPYARARLSFVHCVFVMVGCRYKTLPFHCCALTLQDFKDAMYPPSP
jgi:hypothetical protein